MKLGPGLYQRMLREDYQHSPSRTVARTTLSGGAPSGIANQKSVIISG